MLGGNVMSMTIEKTLEVLGVLIAVSLAANPMKRSVGSLTFSHGTVLCLQGDDGPGRRLVLTPTKSCEGRSSYPRLEIDVKEDPIPLHRRIMIGSENGAFRCLDPKESCEQFLSGEIVFDHFDAKPGNKNEMNTTDGHYLLKTRNGTERGDFKVDCTGACG
jgi:hypothetical protein